MHNMAIFLTSRGARWLFQSLQPPLRAYSPHAGISRWCTGHKLYMKKKVRRVTYVFSIVASTWRTGHKVDMTKQVMHVTSV